MSVEGTNRMTTGGQRPLWLLGKKKEVFIHREGNLGDHGDQGLRSRAGGNLSVASGSVSRGGPAVRGRRWRLRATGLVLHGISLSLKLAPETSAHSSVNPRPQYSSPCALCRSSVSSKAVQPNVLIH